MNERLKQLYQEVIVRHSREPYHFSKEAKGDMIEAYNPLCGDQYKLYVDQRGDTLQSLHFHGYGCSISKAASSILVQSLEGLETVEARTKIKAFMAVLDPNINLAELEIPEDYLAFEAARSFPARLKCASLTWESMAKYLAE